MIPHENHESVYGSFYSLYVLGPGGPYAADANATTALPDETAIVAQSALLLLFAAVARRARDVRCACAANGPFSTESTTRRWRSDRLTARFRPCTCYDKLFEAEHFRPSFSLASRL